MPNPATDVADDEKTETRFRKRNNFVQLVAIKEQKKTPTVCSYLRYLKFLYCYIYIILLSEML